MKKFLVLMAFLLVVVVIELPESIDHGKRGLPFFDPSLAAWEYWIYQYPNVYQGYPIKKEVRKGVFEGKQLNDGKVLKGKLFDRANLGKGKPN